MALAFRPSLRRILAARGMVREETMHRCAVGIVAILGVVAGSGLAPAVAAEANNGLVGTWSLVSISNEKNGQKVLPYGPEAKGALTLDGSRFSLIVVRPGRNRFKSNDRLTGTAEENQETVRGSIAYFGTYTVDPRDSTLVVFRIEGSTFPNWEGAEQKRVLRISGDEMNYTNPTISTGAGIARLVWRRLK